MTSIAPRVLLSDFSLANPIYAEATLYVYEADMAAGGAATTTLATLYRGPSGTEEESNPFRLDGDGKLRQPVYVDGPVVVRVASATVLSHDTGVLGLTQRFRGEWTVGETYQFGDIVRDGIAGENTDYLYICIVTHTASAAFASDLAAGNWEIFFSGAEGLLQADRNLAELTDLAEARTNLGLGNSATLDVGTSAGTVAAGNDARLLGEEGVRALLEEVGLLIRPTPTRKAVGGVTATTARIIFDITATNSAEIETAGVDVSPNADMSSPIYSSANITPTSASGYYTAQFDATGLSASTTYYWRARVNGEAIGTIGTFQTSQVAGMQGNVNVIIASCSNRSYALGDPYATFAPLGATQFIHIGDVDYSDISVNNLSLSRQRNWRYFADTPGVSGMLAAMSVAYTWGDHDAATNDAHWDKELPTGITHETITGNALTVYKEIFPHYPLWNTACIGQDWQNGRVKFIMPDMYRFARYESGDPTFFGTGTNPPSSFDQRTKVLAEIASAGSDGAALVVMLMSAGLYKPVYGSMEERAPGELAQLYDAIRDCPVQVVVMVGDAHQLVADDGTYTDFSSTRDCRVPYFISSGVNWGAPFRSILPTEWNGADGDVSGEVGNSNGFLRLTVTDGGETNVPWQVDFYGAPIAGTSAAHLGTYAYDDIDREAGFNTSNDFKIVDGEDADVLVRKTAGFGICSVDYAWTSGPSGTLTFLPNRTTAAVSRPYTDGTSDTLTLSNPSGCTLAAISTRDLVYYTPETETLTWSAARSTPPSAEVLAAVNTLIAGAKSASLWSKLQILGLRCMDNETDALINVANPGTNDATVVGAVGFVPLQGFRGGNDNGDTTVPHIELDGFAFPSGNRNDHAFGAWVLDAVSSFSGEMGGDQFYLNPNSTTGTALRTRSASTTSTSNTTATAASGFFCVSRTSSTNYKTYVDGSPTATITSSSQALTSSEMWECGFYDPANPSLNQSGGRRVAFTFWASGFSDADMAAWYTLVEAFLADIGATA